MLNLRRLLAVLILVSLLVLGVVIWRHLQQQGPLEVLEALPEQVDLSLEELHYTQTEEGRRSWTLDAEKAEYRRDDGLAKLDAVILLLYRAGQFGELRMTADHGLLRQEEQQVEVWGDVRISTARGDWLYTERLIFDGQRQLLTNNEPVQVSNQRMELAGTGLWADLAAGRLRLEQDVWMLLLPEERK